MKKCSKCKVDKELNEFTKNGYCKECKSNYSKEYVKIHREKILKQNKERYENNKDIVLEKMKDYYLNNKDIIKENVKEYQENNKEKITERRHKYYENNKEEISIIRKEYHIKNKEEILLQKKEYHKNNRNKRNENYQIKLNNPSFKIKETIRKSIMTSIKRGGYKKSSRTCEILGCSFEEFKIYIESQFENWMEWNNHGNYTGNYNETWQYDHIKPVSSGVSEEEIIKLNHYTNFQPLCSKKNLEKSNYY